ncbi:hypothetical protein OXV57_05320 [Bacteroides fragilis]|nr:hypothetical protein [Bacteroides fragilis]
MELFTFIPYFLLLEREESDRNTLANANTEFIREVYELQRVERMLRSSFSSCNI